MEVTIQCIKFDATDKLRDYINKKMSKLDKFFDKAISAKMSFPVPFLEWFSGIWKDMAKEALRGADFLQPLVL